MAPPANEEFEGGSGCALSTREQAIVTGDVCLLVEYRKWLEATRRLIRFERFLKALFCTDRVKQLDRHQVDSVIFQIPEISELAKSHIVRTAEELAAAAAEGQQGTPGNFKMVVGSSESRAAKHGKSVEKSPYEEFGGPDGGTSVLGDLFAVLEAEIGKHGICEYAVTPTTLEQVFHSFAREQA